MSLNLDRIASALASLEETLIYKLLDRAQFLRNLGAYQPGQSLFHPPEALSLFELRLLFQETLDTQFGRYTIPEERPFHSGLPAPRRKPVVDRSEIHISDLETVNVSGYILEHYKKFLDDLCQTGDDGQWGSSVEHDVICLQALARRIHFGSIYVAESKYAESPEKYRALIQAKDEEAIWKALTREEVEEKILVRIGTKVETIQGISDPKLRRLVEPSVVVEFFRSTIIPLTKDGEVRYLMQRPETTRP